MLVEASIQENFNLEIEFNPHITCIMDQFQMSFICTTSYQSSTIREEDHRLHSINMIVHLSVGFYPKNRLYTGYQYDRIVYSHFQITQNITCSYYFLKSNLTIFSLYLHMVKRRSKWKRYEGRRMSDKKSEWQLFVIHKKIVQ